MALAKVPHRNSLLHELVELDINLDSEATGALYLVVHKRQRHLPRVQCVINILRAEFATINTSGAAACAVALGAG